MFVRGTYIDYLHQLLSMGTSFQGFGVATTLWYGFWSPAAKRWLLRRQRRCLLHDRFGEWGRWV